MTFRHALALGYLALSAAACAPDQLLLGGDGGLADGDGDGGKYFDPGPALATTDALSAARLLEHHAAIVARRGYSYTVGDNPAVHRELSQLAGLVRPEVVPKSDTEPLPLLGDPPERWDWREHGAGLVPPQDQGTCGSCWAFSTVAALESAVSAFDNQQVDLSEQYLLDCNTYGYGCGGGFYVHDMHQNPGAVWDGDYPYEMRRRSCRSSGLEHPHKVLRFGDIQAGDLDAIKAAIYQYGAVSTSMNACGSIPGYTGGIYDSTECNGGYTNHAVALVGWDDTVEHRQGRGVWIMRNSWGTRWGEDGYMRMAYGVAQIGMVDATFVEYEPIDPTDTDEDGVIDVRDNCPEDVNADQRDADLDGEGDACDSRFDPVERTLSLSDDDSRAIELGFTFPFFGQEYDEVHVNSDGNVTFGSGDAQAQSRDESRFLSGPPRIGALYADLNPGGGGSVVYRKDDPETLTIAWRNVPEYSRSGGGGSNTAEITIHVSGRIVVTLGDSTLSGNDPKCIVGITRGGSAGGGETDLSASGDGTLAYEGLTAVYEVFAGSEAFDLTGKSVTFAGTAEPNHPPVVDIEASPRAGPSPLEVSFVALASDDDGEIASYHWDFGDRTVSTEPAPVKVFEHDGEYTVTLTVTDDQGGAGTATTVIYVSDDPPDILPDDDDGPGGGGDDDDGDGVPDTPSPGGSGVSPMMGYASCRAAPGSTAGGAEAAMGLLLLGLVLRRLRSSTTP